MPSEYPHGNRYFALMEIEFPVRSAPKPFEIANLLIHIFLEFTTVRFGFEIIHGSFYAIKSGRKQSAQSKHNHIPRVSIYEIVVHNFSKRAILIHRNLFIISLNIGDFPHFLPSLSLCAAFFIVQTLRIQFSSVAMCLKF